MARKKKYKNPQLVTFQLEKSLLEEFDSRVPNKTEFLTRVIVNYLDNSSDDVKMIRLKITEKLNRITELKEEVEELKDRLQDIEETRLLNKENEAIMKNAMNTVERKIASEGGVTEDEVEQIANINKIAPIDLKRKFKKEGHEYISISKKRFNTDTATAHSNMLPLEEEIEYSYDDKINKAISRIKKKKKEFELKKKVDLSLGDYVEQHMDIVENEAKYNEVDIKDVQCALNKITRRKD